ncbi:MAG: hypothetical protein JWP96_84 [Polaromonas sp.]|jgi:hypothetical protein|nr:hypothetical protein [Polaromonas sp.]
MATSSILGGSHLPEEISGKDMRSLGPSDNTDSGSDAVGAYSDEALASDTDSLGTGERASAGPDGEQTDADILPDHIEQAPGAAADIDLDDEAGDDFNDLSEVESLADDSDALPDTEGEEGAAGKT